MNDMSRADPVRRARDLASAIGGVADEIERTRRITEPLLEELHAARLFRMLYPRSVGGDEVEPETYIEAVGELARADGSVGWCVSIANSIGLFAPYLDARVYLLDSVTEIYRRAGPGDANPRLPARSLADGGARTRH